MPPLRLIFSLITAAALTVLTSRTGLGQAALSTGTSQGQVRLGAARFTVVTPQCIRMEYNDRGAFVEEPSYLAVNRDRRFPNATIAVDGREVTIDTGVIALRYKGDGTPFSASNLSATVRQGNATYEWKPGKLNYGNLGGATFTLDQWEGGHCLPDGLLSKDGWCLLDDSKTALLSGSWVKPRPAGSGMDWYLFGYGHDYKSALKALTAIGGEVPLPRRSTLGIWYSRFWNYSSKDFRQIVNEYAAHDYPLDVIVMDMDWHMTDVPGIPCGSSNLVWTGYSWNRKLLPDAEDLLKWFHEQGLTVTLNDHPSGGVRPHEGCYGDFMKAMGKDPASREELPFDVGNSQYMNAFFETAHRPLEKAGVDFWWLDWQQGPFVPHFDSLLNLAWLNEVYFRNSTRDGKRGVSFSRWAGWGDHRHPIHFSGDAATSFKMLAFEVPFTAVSGNSGCFFWSHDIGGHNKGRNEESYARWCQFGAFSAAMRPHSNRDAAMDRRPWTYPDWAERSMRVSYGLRSRFFPYIYSSVRQSCAESVPLVRPMYLEFPELPEAYRQPQQYLFGDHILVAPITAPGAGPARLAGQAVWFPPGGAWYNFFTGERFDGGVEVLVAAGIEELPLYLRGGVPVVMRPFTRRPGSAPLEEAIVRCYPGPEGQTGSFVLYEDDGIGMGYTKGECARTRFTYTREGSHVTVTIEPSEGVFTGQNPERAYTIELPATRPASALEVDGKLARGVYLPGESLNIIKVPARSIRKPCVVTVNAGEEYPEELRARAFAHRAGLPPPAPSATVKELLATALSAHAAHPQATAGAVVVTAAGVGLFEKNETVYGYPDTRTLRAYVPPGTGVQIEPVVESSGTSGSAGKGFKLYIDGAQCALIGAPALGK